MSTGDKVLAVDLGTSYFKVCRFDITGRLEETCTVATPISGAHGRAEIAIQDFRRLLKQAILRVASRTGGRHPTEAISFATQIHSPYSMNTMRR